MLAVSVTAEDVQSVVKKLPEILTKATDLTAKAATIAPQVTPVVRKVLKILPAGPSLAPLIKPINADVAKFLREAPTHTAALQSVIEVLEKAPQIASQTAAATGPLVSFTTRLAADPALGPVTARMMAMVDIAKSRAAGRSKGPPAPATSTDVGLSALVPWLDRGIAVMRRPWVIGAVPLAAFVGVGTFSYLIGRRRGRRAG